MSSFIERYSKLTVAQALEMNEAAGGYRREVLCA